MNEVGVGFKNLFVKLCKSGCIEEPGSSDHRKDNRPELKVLPFDWSISHKFCPLIGLSGKNPDL